MTGKLTTSASEIEINVLRETLARDNSLSRCSAVKALERIGSRSAATSAALIELLEDGDPDVRADAASALGQLKIAEAVMPLLDTLEQDADGDTRIVAARSLAKIGTADAVERLMKCVEAEGYPELDGPNDEMEYRACWEVQAQCLEALGEIGDARATDLVITLLNDDELDHLHPSCFRILAKLDSDAAELFLLSCIRDGDRAKRRKAIIAIAAADRMSTLKNEHELVEVLCLALKDNDAGVRLNAVQALGRIGNADGIVRIAALLTDEDREVRQEVAATLHAVHGQRIVRTLHIMLREPDPILQAHLAELLGEIGDQTSLPLLEELLSSEDERVLYAVLGAVIKFGTASTVEPITPLLVDPRKDVTLRARAAEALGVIISDQRKNSSEADKPERNAIRESLRAKSLDPEECLVTVMLTDEVPVQYAALTALLKIFETEAVPILIACLTQFEGDEQVPEQDAEQGEVPPAADPKTSTIAAMISAADPADLEDAKAAEAYVRQQLRVLAARMLPGFVGTDQEDVVAALISKANADEPELHRQVILALGQIGDPAATECVLEAFQSENADVRLAALDAMSNFEDNTDVDEILDALLKDPDAGIRARAVQSIGNGKADRATNVLASALSDNAIEVCRAALIAVTPDTISGKFVSGTMDLMFRFPDQLRHEAASTLRRVEDRSISEPLMEMLNDPSQEEFHWICIDALGDLHASEQALEA